MIHKIYSGKYNFWGVLNGSSKLLNISSTNNFFPYCIINIHFALKTEKPPLPSETLSYGLVIYLLIFFSPFCHGALRKTWDKVFRSGPNKICERQPLKNFTSSTLEYFVPNMDSA